MAQAIFKSWFIDFEPVKAKIEAKEAGQDAEGILLAAMSAISGKDSKALKTLQTTALEEYTELKAIAEQFPDSLEESELGMIPKGWEVGELNNLIEFNPKRTIKKGIIAPYVGMSDIPERGSQITNFIYREMTSGSKFINGDTLFARITPCLENGKTAYVDILKENEIAWGSTEFIVMRSRENIPLFISYLIARLDSFRNFAMQSMSGTSGRQRADKNVIEQLDWVIAPNKLYTLFGNLVNNYPLIMRNNSQQNKTLTELRDTLLPKLLSGEIDVSNVEIMK